jgi:hypothetical protein
MKIDEITIGQAKELVSMLGNVNGESQAHPFTIGDAYLIRTVTMTISGRLIEVYPTELVFEDAAWIADTGRFSESFTSGFDEVEPFPSGRVIVGRGALIDMTAMSMSLPRSVK